MEAQLEAKAAADEVAVADYIKKVDGQIDEASVTLNNIKALPPFGKDNTTISTFFNNYFSLGSVLKNVLKLLLLRTNDSS